MIDGSQDDREPLCIGLAGMGHSGDPLWAERDEEILAAAIDPIEGWLHSGREVAAPGDEETPDDDA